LIVGLKILDSFQIECAEQLVKELSSKGFLTLTLEQVKKLVEKAWDENFDWEDLRCDDDCIDYILSDLANGYFYWECDNIGLFTINIIDQNNPFFKHGSIPKEKVTFT
jgi:hypothetical protein